MTSDTPVPSWTRSGAYTDIRYETAEGIDR